MIWFRTVPRRPPPSRSSLRSSAASVLRNYELVRLPAFPPPSHLEHQNRISKYNLQKALFSCIRNANSSAMRRFLWQDARLQKQSECPDNVEELYSKGDGTYRKFLMDVWVRTEGRWGYKKVRGKSIQSGNRTTTNVAGKLESKKKREAELQAWQESLVLAAKDKRVLGAVGGVVCQRGHGEPPPLEEEPPDDRTIPSSSPGEGGPPRGRGADFPPPPPAFSRLRHPANDRFPSAYERKRSKIDAFHPSGPEHEKMLRYLFQTYRPAESFLRQSESRIVRETIFRDGSDQRAPLPGPAPVEGGSGGGGPAACGSSIFTEEPPAEENTSDGGDGGAVSYAKQ